MGLDRGMEILVRTEAKVQPGHVGRIIAVSIPGIPVRPGIGHVVPRLLPEGSPAVRTRARVALPEPLDVVRHNPIYPRRVERPQIGEIGPPVVRIVEAHTPPAIVRTRPFAGAPVNLAKRGERNAAHIRIRVAVLPEVRPRRPGRSTDAQHPVHMILLLPVQRVERQMTGMVFRDPYTVQMARLNHARQGLGEGPPVPSERPPEVRTAEGDHVIDARGR